MMPNNFLGHNVARNAGINIGESVAIKSVLHDDPNVPMPQLYGGALFAYHHHNEMKYPGGDRAGLLGRWQIHATDEFHYLGKEIERKRETGDNLADILMEPPLEYKPLKHRSPGSRRTLHPVVIEKLKSRFSIKQLQEKPGSIAM
jgi:hypothetical protein